MFERARGCRRSDLEKKRIRAEVELVKSKAVTMTVRLTLPELPVHLSAEKMEGVCWGSAVRNLHVAVLVLAIKLVGSGEDTGILAQC